MVLICVRSHMDCQATPRRKYVRALSCPSWYFFAYYHYQNYEVRSPVKPLVPSPRAPPFSFVHHYDTSYHNRHHRPHVHSRNPRPFIISNKIATCSFRKESHIAWPKPLTDRKFPIWKVIKTIEYIRSVQNISTHRNVCYEFVLSNTDCWFAISTWLKPHSC